MAGESVCSEKQFKNFFLLKAFDIIGNGSFKKHLARCKDTNDMWAIEMNNDVQHMQAVIKEINVKVQDIPRTPNRIFEICKDVMTSAQPPVKMFAGTVTCTITKNICNRCLDFSKIHKKDTNVFVDARFSHFFLFLWYTNKIEYIIRSYVRHWVYSQTESDYKTLCEKIQSDLSTKINAMYCLYIKAYNHVMLTLSKLDTMHSQKILMDV
jgi:hypothetical protein